MDNPFRAGKFYVSPGLLRRSPRRRFIRTAIIGLAFWIIAPHALAQAQPSIAPEGKFLPNDPYILPNPPVFKLFGIGPPQIPPPETGQYETRLGWLIGSNSDYHTRAIQADSTEQDYAKAVRKEMERMARLSGQPRQDYLLGVVRDLGTLEKQNFIYRAPYRLIQAAGFDYLVGAAGSAALRGARVKGLVTFAKDGMTSGIADLVAQANKEVLSASNARMSMLKQYVTARCGCPFPMQGQFRPPQAWDLAIPPVRGRYETTLARILASGGKTMSRLWDRRQSFAGQEAKRLLRLRTDKPQEFAAYMINFCYDLETLQQELLDDQKVPWDVSLMTSIGFGVAASVAGAGLGAAAASASTQAAKLPPILNIALRAVLSSRSAILNPSAGATLSAATSVWSEYESLSAEEQVLVGVDALRRIALDGIRQIQGDCGCAEKAKPRKPEKKPAIRFEEGNREGYWLVAFGGGMLDIYYGDEEHAILNNGRDNVLAGPIKGVSRGDAAAAFCGQISNPRWDPSPLKNGFYGEFKGQTYNIGRLGGCGAKMDK